MVDAVVTVFLEKLLGALSEESHIFSEFGDHFETLQNELLLMQSFLKDAERLNRKNQTIRSIMANAETTNLRELIYEAEDILADCQLHSRNEVPFSGGWLMCIYSSKLSFQYQTGKSLREINKKIASIKQNISSYLGVPLLNQLELIDAQNEDGAGLYMAIPKLLVWKTMQLS
ncbi:hypothetical protein M0R45_019876 [Rubus argutus]|uniref:Disease resistance N-terminal domain-containing protein n=1 Tax=Rubus argutus TaxID=59490 RepID=A0AAW1X8D1_RUBAR